MAGERFRTSTTEKLREIRKEIRHEVVRFPEIIEGNPDKWWRSTARMVIGFRKRLEKCPNKEVVEYFEGYVDKTLETLRSASKSPIKTDETDVIVDQTEHMIMGASLEMAKQFEPEKLDIETYFMPLAEMVRLFPDRFQSREEEVNQIPCVILRIKHPTEEKWIEAPLPIGKKIWLKGGASRAAMGVIANAPLSMQKSEYPLHDLDALVAGDRENAVIAKKIGVDADGIEQMGEDDLNFPGFCFGRDTQQNQVCLGAEGIYYSRGALESARTGHISIVSEYMPTKAIYGSDRAIIQGIDLAKQRGLMRLVKSVAEGKALSFDYIPLNASFDMGLQVLFLAKRWSKKERFPELLQHMYYLLKQMDQVKEGENDIFDVMERTHRKSPFFDFDVEIHSPMEVARWKSRKIAKQIDREAAWKLGLPSTMVLERFDGDTIPHAVSLEGFVADQDSANYQKNWEAFLKNARERTSRYGDKNMSMYERLFVASYEDTDDLPASSEMTLT